MTGCPGEELEDFEQYFHLHPLHIAKQFLSSLGEKKVQDNKGVRLVPQNTLVSKADPEPLPSTL